MVSTGVIGAYLSAEERLRNPILQMLSRKHDVAFCIAIVKSVFPRTADALSLAEFTARLETCLAVLSQDESCDLPTWCSDEAGTVGDLPAAAMQVFNVLAKPLTAGGYGWLRHERTEDTLEETVFISMEGLSALDLYDRLGMESKAFTGVKAEDFASQLTDLTTMLTMDRHARIRQLEQRIAPYLEQIEVLKAGGDVDPIEGRQVEERLQHMYDIVTQMPTAIRRTRDAEKRAIEELAETYRTGSMTAAASVTRYTDTFVERFETSDDGKSYRQATNTLFGLRDASRLNTIRLMIASTAQTTSTVQGLLDGIELRLGDIFTELRGVQEVFGEGMAVFQRVSSQRENARWRTEIETLACATECFKAWTARTKGRNPKFPITLPYGYRGNMCFYPHEADLDFGKARPAPLGASQVDEEFDVGRQIDCARKASSGSAKRILMKLMVHAAPDGNGIVDLASGFNALERPDRLVQDMAALFCKFGNGSPMAGNLWRSVDADGNEIVFMSGELNVPVDEIRHYLDGEGESENE